MRNRMIILLIILMAGILILPAQARQVEVKGKVNAPEIASINVENIVANYDRKTGSFTANLTLNETGKNTLWINGLDAKGNLVCSKRVRVLNLVSFYDVIKSYWASEQIGLIATLGILNGYPDQTFKPEHAVTRAEMAAILIRAKGIDIPEPTIAVFKDVKLSHWGAKYIDLAQKLGLIKGYPDKTYHPNQQITRAEGITMITRFAKLDPEAYNNNFVDITPSHWAARTLASAYNARLLEYIKGKPFEANKALTRAETVEMLSRTQFAQEKIAELLSFEVGYENTQDAKKAATINDPKNT